MGIIADQLMKATLTHLMATQQDSGFQFGLLKFQIILEGGLFISLLGYWGNFLSSLILIFLSLYFLYRDVFTKTIAGHVGPAVLLTGSLSNFFDLLTNERYIETVILEILNSKLLFSLADIFVLLGLLLIFMKLIKLKRLKN
ncbi:MAG: hypothetical protein Fur0010_07500 [Bdellovibrio sp.]